jgi:hypothetical protein
LNLNHHFSIMIHGCSAFKTSIKNIVQQVLKLLYTSSFRGRGGYLINNKNNIKIVVLHYQYRYSIFQNKLFCQMFWNENIWSNKYQIHQNQLNVTPHQYKKSSLPNQQGDNQTNRNLQDCTMWNDWFIPIVIYWIGAQSSWPQQLWCSPN